MANIDTISMKVYIVVGGEQYEIGANVDNYDACHYYPQDVVAWHDEQCDSDIFEHLNQADYIGFEPCEDSEIWTAKDKTIWALDQWNEIEF